MSRDSKNISNAGPAHAKAGDAAAIAGYLGSGNTFDSAVTEYATGYADQVERTMRVFVPRFEKGDFQLKRCLQSWSNPFDRGGRCWERPILSSFCAPMRGCAAQMGR